MVEEWRDIVITKNGVIYDYGGLYEVSNLGRVRNVKTGRVLKPRKTQGYLKVGLYYNKEMNQLSVHRLVATAFIPNPDNLECVNHKDENKQNNHISNLEWCTKQYNTKYSGHKISEALKGKKHTEEAKQKIGEARIGKYTRKDSSFAKPVVCLNTGEKFECIMDARDWCNGSCATIGMCCKGTRLSSGKHPVTSEKLCWMFLEDYENTTKNEIENKLKRSNEDRQQQGKDNPNAKAVICLETEQVFDTVKEAKDWVGKGSVCDCCKGRVKTAGGYHWMYLDDYLAQQTDVESFN